MHQFCVGLGEIDRLIATAFPLEYFLRFAFLKGKQTKTRASTHAYAVAEVCWVKKTPTKAMETEMCKKATRFHILVLSCQFLKVSKRP